MCGRFTLTLDEEVLLDYTMEHFDLDTLPESIKVPRYNIAPSQSVLGIFIEGSRYDFKAFEWGFLPPWWTSASSMRPLINARSETINEKPTFKSAFEHKRCIILSDGFYEWDQASKHPYHFTTPNHSPCFAYAGLYSKHPSNTGHTAVILTKAANPDMKGHHPRMPVILDAKAAKRWMDKNASIESLHALIDRANPSLLGVPVSTKVNSPKHDSPDLIKRNTPHTLFDI